MQDLATAMRAYDDELDAMLYPIMLNATADKADVTNETDGSDMVDQIASEIAPFVQHSSYEAEELRFMTLKLVPAWNVYLDQLHCMPVFKCQAEVSEQDFYSIETVDLTDEKSAAAQEEAYITWGTAALQLNQQKDLLDKMYRYYSELREMMGDARSSQDAGMLPFNSSYSTWVSRIEPFAAIDWDDEIPF
jgi:hypothetical protein